MKLAEMVEIQQNRENLIEFLSYQQQLVLLNILNIDVSLLSFEDVCTIVLSQYKQKLLSNKQASECFNILSIANTDFRIERYRYNENTQDLYKYSFNHDCYIFVDKCSKKVYKSKYANQYV